MNRPAVTRRQALRSLGMGGALGLAAAGSVYAAFPAAAQPAADPLLALICEYREARATWLAMPSESDDECDAFDTFCRSRVNPLFWRIAEDTPPATTAAGALAALQLVNEKDAGEVLAYDKALMAAAIQFLDREAA